MLHTLPQKDVGLMGPSDIPTEAQEHLSGHDIWLTSTLYTQRKKKNLP